jgi:hypothetical protein
MNWQASAGKVCLTRSFVIVIVYQTTSQPSVVLSRKALESWIAHPLRRTKDKDVVKLEDTPKFKALADLTMQDPPTKPSTLTFRTSVFSNADIMCPHDKLDPSKAMDMKCINTVCNTQLCSADLTSDLRFVDGLP